MRKLTVSITVLGAIFIGITGCSHRLTDQQARRDQILDMYFTDDAAGVLRNIPLRSIAGNETKYRGIAIGDDPFTRLWGIILGLGDARQVVVSEKHLDDDGLIVHEFLHQADYSGLLDRHEFVQQFALLKTDPDHANYAARRQDSILESYGGSLFGQAELMLFDGLSIELVAFVGKDIATGDILPPPYLSKVFAGILRLPTPTVEAPVRVANAAE